MLEKISKIQNHQQEFQISHKSYWKLLLQSIFMIIVMFIAETFILFLAEKPQYYWIAILAVIIAFLLLYAFKLKLFNFSMLTKKQWLFILIAFVVVSAIDFLYLSFMPTPPNQKDLDASFEHIPFYLQILTIGILGPIIEEVMFRGLLIKGVFRGAPIIGGVVSVILFAGAHGPTNISEWLIYGLSGVVLVIAYLKTKRLEVPIVIHALSNILSVFLSNFWW
ncbi:CPBP family intramembrane metalloprotease [Staphylococcus devriesei]|uniref:CPBP family intramembrane metalloprotease n=1 Tax=Staphylococcus devriesei TaxID=586733 RepID=A0A2K4DUK6_9STAP|nr:type II CAAX endopeptidase family protein [Staphylococcus devriesei]MCE5090459.1 CPBP family intramembrane metalloprotease [Staphylococcus devriesei]PNZ90506.1 CPBP family intramembrane metalloprotease [Staphylococcus devriesei]PTE74622.1 CPBP family intramembrane metalloprotease [Staphylococcus devriesei]PTF05025.1 CPBP family intramembrane metalloprotease [Staphylococcus devriesei]PTF13640.1 CPBP family intramembrane metalloprotease [Staphylococcus devriesei]